MKGSKFNDEIYFEKYGEGENKMICLHGFGASHLSFKELGHELKDSFTLYSVDLVGFGKSVNPETFKFSLKEQGEFLEFFIKEIGIKKYYLLGHSYGAAVVLKLLTQNNFLNIPKPKHLFLISPLAYVEKHPFFITVLTNSLLNLINRKLVPSKLQARIILRYLFYKASKISRQQIIDYALYYKSKKNTNTLTKTARKLKSGDGSEMFSNYKDIEMAISIIYGNNDRLITKENIYKLNSELKKSVVNLIDKCGHIPHEENVHEVEKIIKNISHA